MDKKFFIKCSCCQCTSSWINVVHEKAMATHSSTLAWKMPWTEEPVRGVAKSRAWWETSLSLFTLEKEMATNSSDLAWRIPGIGEPGGLPSMGSHRVGHDWSDLAAAAVHERLKQNKTKQKTTVETTMYGNKFCIISDNCLMRHIVPTMLISTTSSLPRLITCNLSYFIRKRVPLKLMKSKYPGIESGNL